MALGRGVGADVGLDVGLGVGLGVGAPVAALVGAGVAPLPGWVDGVALAPGPVFAARPGVGAVPNDRSGPIEANVSGPRPEAIARSGGGAWLGPRADGAQATMSATTSVTPTASDGCLRFTSRG